MIVDSFEISLRVKLGQCHQFGASFESSAHQNSDAVCVEERQKANVNVLEVGRSRAMIGTPWFNDLHGVRHHIPMGQHHIFR